MSEAEKWQFELEKYIKQGELGQIEKSEAWQIAIGLQANFLLLNGLTFIGRL